MLRAGMKQGILPFILILSGAPMALGEDIVLMATGMTRGNLERCGCVAKQTGGLEPRAAYLNHTQSSGQDFLLFDTGSFVGTAREPVEDSINTAIVEAMSLLNYSAASLGRSELMLPMEKLEPLLKSATFPILAANLKFTDPSQTPLWKPSIVIEHKGKRVGVVGVVPSLGRSPLLAKGLEIEPFREWTTQRLLDIVGEPVDLIVLLTQEGLTPVQTFLQNAQDLETPIIALNKQWSKMKTPVGRHTAIGVYSQGKRITHASLSFEAENPVGTVFMHPLDPAQRKDEAMRAFLDAFYLSAAQMEDVKAKLPPALMGMDAEKRQGDGYLGAETCKPCHTSEYMQWYRSRHRRSYLALLNRRRYFVPDCINCHTTGYGHPEGFTRFTQTEHLASVQCETCHGPGRLHGADPEKAKMRMEMDQGFCMQCHDEKNSPGFAARFDKAWLKILHKPTAVAAPGVAEPGVSSATAYGTAGEVPVIPVIPVSKMRSETPSARPSG